MVMKTEGGDVRYRLMRVNDIDSVMDVERASFPIPWSPNAFLGELKKNDFAHYMIAEVDGRIVAYSGLWIIMDEAHVTNIAVHPDFRRRKIGKNMLINLVYLAQIQGASKMTLEVRVSNVIAQQLYMQLGFQKAGIRKEYYTDNREDAIIMWVDLDEAKQRISNITEGVNCNTRN